MTVESATYFKEGYKELGGNYGQVAWVQAIKELGLHLLFCSIY